LIVRLTTVPRLASAIIYNGSRRPDASIMSGMTNGVFIELRR
jgi:hypothetical protein